MPFLSPLPFAHSSRSGSASFPGKIIYARINQRPGGTGLNTGRHRAVGTAIAAIRFVLLQLPPDDTVRTYHHASPTADALILVRHHHAVFGTPDGARDTGMHARRILTVAAKYGHRRFDGVTDSTYRRCFGRGCSAIAPYKDRLPECSTAQASSHERHPMHLSRRTNISLGSDIISSSLYRHNP